MQISYFLRITFTTLGFKNHKIRQIFEIRFLIVANKKICPLSNREDQYLIKAEEVVIINLK